MFQDVLIGTVLLMIQLQFNLVYFSRTCDINIVGNHFDSVGHSLCDYLNSSFVKTSLSKVSMRSWSVGDELRTVIGQSR